jgi:hypothetical protein
VVFMLLAALCASLLSVSTTTIVEVRAHEERTRAFYNAEAAISAAIAELTSGADPGCDGVGNINGEFGAGYYSAVATDNGDRTWTVLAAGISGGQARVLEVTIKERPTGPFCGMVFGVQGVTIGGNALCDSYDTLLGSYAGQVAGGHARENCDVASNGDIRLVGDVRLYGDATPGPGHKVIMPGSVFVSGSTCPAEEMRVVEKYVYKPEGTDIGALVGTQTLSSGTYHCSEIRLTNSDTLYLGGLKGDRVTLYVDGFISVTGSAKIQVHEGASAILHHGGDGKKGILLAGGGMVNSSGVPACCMIYSAATAWITVAGESDFYGTIYAPDAPLTLAGTHDYYGAVVGAAVGMFGNGIHYDEALGYLDSAARPHYESKSWRELGR